MCSSTKPVARWPKIRYAAQAGYQPPPRHLCSATSGGILILDMPSHNMELPPAQAPAADAAQDQLPLLDILPERGVAIYVEPRKLALGSVQPNLNLNPVRTIRFGKPITASISASNFTNRVKAGVLE